MDKTRPWLHNSQNGCNTKRYIDIIEMGRELEMF